jgi:Family of unknown function (DUF5715)
MSRRERYFLLLIIATASIYIGAWAVFHFRALERHALQQSNVSTQPIQPIELPADPDLWARSMEKMKEDRGGSENVALEIPAQLRHYEDRHWFLATQVAEVKKFNLQSVQDFVDLAAMIKRGELVPVPAVTETYILFGVGARVDDGGFTRYVDNQNIEPNDEGGLRDYQPLQTLARNFRGRSFNLDDSSDRQELKIYLLSSLRREGLKILEAVAKLYHDKFDRPLPVSSLVRPEQYQHVLRRFNRYAVLIDTPPHSTGLAFDIDYRFMSGAEQNFLMAELARLKDDGRIEVIRERGANYHVFAFIDGQRPSDELITASLEEAGAPEKETNHAEKSEENTATKSRRAKRK